MQRGMRSLLAVCTTRRRALRAQRNATAGTDIAKVAFWFLLLQEQHACQQNGCHCDSMNYTARIEAGMQHIGRNIVCVSCHYRVDQAFDPNSKERTDDGGVEQWRAGLCKDIQSWQVYCFG